MEEEDRNPLSGITRQGGTHQRAYFYNYCRRPLIYLNPTIRDVLLPFSFRILRRSRSTLTLSLSLSLRCEKEKEEEEKERERGGGGEGAYHREMLPRSAIR